jgi:hypothetical protein
VVSVNASTSSVSRAAPWFRPLWKRCEELGHL